VVVERPSNDSRIVANHPERCPDVGTFEASLLALSLSQHRLVLAR